MRIAATRLLIFDFDGVLADSEPMHRLAYNRALEPYGHQVEERAYWRYWTSMGEGIRGEIRRAGLRDVDPVAVTTEKRSIYEGLCRSGAVPLYPGAVELVEAIIRCERWRVVIASNTDAELVRAVLTAGGCMVPDIVGGDDLPPKPSPDIFLRACAVMETEPASSLVFEDAWKGVQAARSAAIPVALVLNQINRDLDIRADYTIDGLPAVMDLLVPHPVAGHGSV